MQSHSSVQQDLFEHLSLGRVFNRTLSVFVDRFDVYLTLSAVVLVPLAVLGFVTGLILGVEAVTAESSSAANANGMDPNDAATLILMDFIKKHVGLLVSVFLLQSLLSLFIVIIGEGGMIRAVADSYASQATGGWLKVLKIAGLQQFPRLLGAAFLVRAPVVVGLVVVTLLFAVAASNNSLFWWFFWVMALVAFLCFLIWFIPAVLLVFPVIIVENRGPRMAIRRSIEITQGRRCYAFCAVCLIWLVKLILAQLLHNIFDTENPLAALLSPAGIFIGLIPDLLYLPFYSILTFVLYVSICVDKEGLTQSALQRSLVEPLVYSAPNVDYRQVTLMEDNSDDAIAHGLVSEFA